MIFDKADILQTIAHRPPILLVDGVVSLEKDTEIQTFRDFPDGDPAFDGHFPGNPVLPGVLGIEALAQSAAILVNKSRGKMAEETLFLFMGIEKVRFRASVYPESRLSMHVKQVKKIRDIYRFEGLAQVGDTVCTEVTFTAKLVEK